MEDDADIVWHARNNDDETTRFKLAKRKDGADGLSYTLRGKRVGPSLVLDSELLSADDDPAPKHAHDILSLLRSLAHHDVGASPTTLAEAIGVSRGGTSKPCNWLIAHDLIVKRVEAGNRVRYVAKDTRYGTNPSSEGGRRTPSSSGPEDGASSPSSE